ncbi:MAG: helix-turn-helix transcriptional regulator [Dehalococcoidia bacterium]
MRRADRLFELIQHMRRKPVVTAQWLARELEVSERTVYRDIRDLQLSGVPIDGEAGVGYTLRKGYDLPPLMFTAAEIEALVLGARVVGSWGDAELGKSAHSAIQRIESVLPEKLRARLQDTRLFAPGFHVRDAAVQHLSLVREAINARRVLWLSYSDASGAGTERRIRPVGLFFWGHTWSIEAWCELRRDFRGFRLDRIQEIRILDDLIPDEPGTGLEDFQRLYREESGDGGRG